MLASPVELRFTSLMDFFIHQPAAFNECNMIAGICENGKCMDTKGGYMCMCNPGFKLSMNGKKCTGEC